MGINTEPAPPNNHDQTLGVGRTVLETVTKYKKDEKERWNRRIISLIFVGLLISVLVHINIGFLLNLLIRSGSGSNPTGAFVTIDFAIEDSQTLTSLPEGESLDTLEAVQTQAPSESLQATQATLTADEATEALEAAATSTAPSLAGSGSSGMGVGLGGSGGGGSSF
ncbi:MAG TPA: hypothetical protein EYO31_09995, partial [Phycisphaerales bacterium]|nr:hypothetical protein [Phycisphaerales bacterium]